MLVCAMAGFPQLPDQLPFLEALSWFDQQPRKLTRRQMLERYESGWRHLGVIGTPSPEERVFLQALIDEYGSFLRI